MNSVFEDCFPDRRCDDVSCGWKANTPDILYQGLLHVRRNYKRADIADCLSMYVDDPYHGFVASIPKIPSAYKIKNANRLDTGIGKLYGSWEEADRFHKQVMTKDHPSLFGL